MSKGKIITLIGGTMVIVGLLTFFINQQPHKGYDAQSYEIPLSYNYFKNDLTIESGQSISVKRGWYLEDIFVFLNPQQSEIPIKIVVKKENGQIHWTADTKGEFRDSFVVIPKENYLVIVSNEGSESVTFTNFEFNNPTFYDRDGNFIPSRSGIDLLVIFILMPGIGILIVGWLIAKGAGEEWAQK